MSVNQQILIVAGLAGLAAIAVPSFVDTPSSSTPQEAANITRADENAPVQNSNLFGNQKKRMAKAPSRHTNCDTNRDFKVSNCAQALRKLPKSGRMKRSKGGRSITIAQDVQGHFRVTTRMNGRRIPVLIDTGATSVAINMRTARRLGLNLKQDDFKHEASTANGKTLYALAKIREIRIGGIVVDDVEAAVLSDKALSSTLLGMSFLKRLSKYSVEGGHLKMTQ